VATCAVADEVWYRIHSDFRPDTRTSGQIILTKGRITGDATPKLPLLLGGFGPHGGNITSAGWQITLCDPI